MRTVKAKRKKIVAKNKTVTEYLTKRVLIRAANRAFKIAAAETMLVQGYNVVAENGWVVKIYADGKREQVKQIPTIQRPAHITLL